MERRVLRRLSSGADSRTHGSLKRAGSIHSGARFARSSYRSLSFVWFLKSIDLGQVASKRLRVDTIYMRFRATLASLLAVILLSLSPLSSACQIHCDRASQGASCHSTAAHSSPQSSNSMPAMPGMGESQVAEANPGFPVVSGAAQSCFHHVCAQQPVLLKSAPQAFTSLDLSHQVPLLYSLPQAYAVPSGIVPVRGPPPIQRASPVSLHTTLRT
jgi:hypothetical protein